MKAIIKIPTNKSYKSVEEIKATIEEALKFHKIVEEDEIEYFFSGERVFYGRLSVWDEEHQGEILYTVTIWEYYVGWMDYDYVYTYTIE